LVAGGAKGEECSSLVLVVRRSRYNGCVQLYT